MSRKRDRSNGPVNDRNQSADSRIEAIYERHQELMRTYTQAKRTTTKAISAADLHALRANFQFIRDEEADADRANNDWQVRMSIRYYQQLFREYAIADLSRHREGKIGLRWRTEMEVIQGKGQFTCGNKRCEETTSLHSYEVLFAYVEHGEKKRCLVKVRLCEACAQQLFYKKLQNLQEKQSKKQHKKRRKRKGSFSSDGAGSSQEEDASEHENVHAMCAKINAQEVIESGLPSANAPQSSDDEKDVSLQELLL